MWKFLIVAALLFLVAPVAAQNDLSAGSTVVGQTGTVYNMRGKAGELLVAEAIGITPGLTPRLILTLGTDPNPIAVSESLQPGSTTLTYRLPQDGSFNLKVDGRGASGQFALALMHSPAETPVPLGDQTTLSTGSYTFTAPAELHLSGSGWIAEVRDAFGQIVARVSDAPSANMLIGASGTYELAILSGSVAAEYHPRPDLETAPPASTEQATPSPATPSSKLAPASARRQTMTYGSGIQGTISAAGGTASFPFTGKAGDLVFARVLPLSDGLEATLSVVAPDGSPSVSSVGGALTDRLSSSGPYVLVVTAQSGTSGDFVVRLDAQTGRLLPLSLGQLTNAQFLAGGTPQVYHFGQNPSAQLLMTLSADDPAFRFSSIVRSHDGQAVAYFNGEMRSVVLTLDPGAGSFELTLTPDDPASQGLILIDLETNTLPGSATPTPAPSSTAPTHAPASATPTRTPTRTPVPPTPTATFTPIPPSATPTRTPLPPTPTATFTPIPSSATPTRTPTRTSVPPTATAMFTPIPASPTPVTATFTPISATSTPAFTPIPPSPTPVTATFTPISATSTPSPLPVSATPTATPTPASQAVPGAVYCHLSSNGSANIRSAPNTSAPIVDRLTRSQSVDVIGLSPDGGWYAVRLATQVGWVSTAVVREIDPCVNVPPLSP